MEDKIIDINNLEHRYLIKDLTRNDCELLRDSNIECHVAKITKAINLNIQKIREFDEYLYTDYGELDNSLLLIEERTEDTNLKCDIDTFDFDEHIKLHFDKKEPEITKGEINMTNRISIIGNINKENIEINEEKGFAKFSMAVSNGKDQEPQWYNLTHFINKDGADQVLSDLKKIQTLEKSPQIKVNGYLSYNNVQKENEFGEKETKTYTNLIANSIKINESFELPKAKVKLEGTLHKELATIENTSIDANGMEVKKDFSHLTIKTADKDGNYEKFHFVGTTNKDQSNILSQGKAGDSISLEARLSPKGSIKVTKECPITIQRANGEKITNKSPAKSKSVDR
jgi:hypothetical protein